MLRDYRHSDLDLQLRLLGDAETMAHLGGPETREQIVRRHDRSLRMHDAEDGRMLVITDDDGTAVGTIGYWTRVWSGTDVWEAGWFVLPEQRGRGFASAGLLATIAELRTLGSRKALHAFPSVDNPASNAVCAKAGLTLVAPVDFEYPAGHLMRCNDWSIDLVT